MKMFGETVPSKEDYYVLANWLCEVFFDPTVSSAKMSERMTPLMKQLCRLVSVDHAHSYYMQSEKKATDVHVED